MVMPFPGEVNPARSVWGLDLSLTSTGRALIWWPEDFMTCEARVHMDHVTSTGHDNDSWEQRMLRWSRLTYRVCADIKPGSIVYVEGPALALHHKSSWDRAAFWGHVVLSLRGRGCYVVVVAPNLRIKYATGKSNGEKTHVVAAVVKNYPTIDFSGQDDETDAFVLAAMAARMSAVPIEAEPISDARLDALKTLAHPV